MHLRWLIFLALVVLTACAPHPSPADGEPAAETPSGPPDDAEPANTNRWRADAETIAKTYAAWGRVDDEARWAPGLCRMPQPASARFSESVDAKTHGGKLYTLYAKDPKAYGAPVGFGWGLSDQQGMRFEQVIVKEAWTPERIKDWEDTRGWAVAWGKSGLSPAIKDGVAYGANERSGLYLMFKLPGEPADGTDKGWVYATLAPRRLPAGSSAPPGEPMPWTVTAAGRMASCMECHVDADGEGGRLFGLPGKTKRPR